MTGSNLASATEADASQTTTTAEVVAATARRLGAAHLFEIMGASNMRVVHAFREAGARLHHFRHENGAVGAADGWARATGEVGWASVVHGPGLTNAVTALRTAVKARTPLVLITGDVTGTPSRTAPFEVGNQGLSPDGLLAEIGVTVVRTTPDLAAADTVAAHHLARATRCPVALVVPRGVDARPSSADVDRALATLPAAATAAGPTESALAAAEEALRSARSIVLLAGGGAADRATVRVLERLGECLGAYLATSVRGIGAFDGSPAALGVFGGFSTPEAVRVIRDADLVLAIGVSLNHIQTRRSTLLAGSVIVQIDDDPAAFGRYDRADVAVLGDARLTAEALLARFESTPMSPPRTVPRAPARPDFSDTSTAGLIDPRALATALDRILPSERAAVVDGGHFTVWPIAFMHHATPQSLLWTCDFGAMGCGLGPAIGAAIGRPDRLTALYIGDCGLFMSLGDLEVAAREALPLLVVCFNDGAAGSEVVLSEIAGLPSDDAIFGVSDIAGIAASIGAASAVVRTVGDVEDAFAAWERRGPLVLDCRIDPAVRSPLYAQYA